MLTNSIKSKKLFILAFVIAMLTAAVMGGAAGGNMTTTAHLQRTVMATIATKTTTTPTATMTTTTTLASSNAPATISNVVRRGVSTGSAALSPTTTATATTTTTTKMYEQQQQHHNESANRSPAATATVTTVTRKPNDKMTPTVNTFNMPTAATTTTTTINVELASKSRTDVADQQQQQHQRQSNGNETQTQIKNAKEQLNQPATTTTTPTQTKLNDNNNNNNNNNNEMTETTTIITTNKTPTVIESATETLTELQFQLNTAKNPRKKKKPTDITITTSSAAKPTTKTTTTQRNDMHVEGKLKNELYRITSPEILTDEFNGLPPSPATTTTTATVTVTTIRPQINKAATTTTAFTATEYDEQPRRQSSTQRAVHERPEEEQAHQLEHEQTRIEQPLQLPREQKAETETNAENLHRVVLTPGRVNIVDLYPMKMEDFKPIIRDSNAKLLKERTIYESRYDGDGDGVDLVAADKMPFDKQQQQQQRLQKLQNLLPNEVEIVQHRTQQKQQEQQQSVMAATHNLMLNHAAPNVATRAINSISDFTGKLLAEQDGVITEIEQKFRLSEFSGTSTSSTTTTTTQSTPQQQEQQQRPPVHSVNQRLLNGNAAGGVFDFIDRRVKKSFDFPLHHRTASDAMAVPHIDFANTKFSSDTKSVDRVGLDAGQPNAMVGNGAMGSTTGSGAHPEFSTTKFYNSKELYNEMLLHSKLQQQQQLQKFKFMAPASGNTTTTTTNRPAFPNSSKLFGKVTTAVDLQETTTTPARAASTTTVPTTTTATTAGAAAAAAASNIKFYRQNTLRRGDMWRANKMYTRPLLTTSTSTTTTTTTTTKTTTTSAAPSTDSASSTTTAHNSNSTVASGTTTSHTTISNSNGNENFLISSSSPLDSAHQRVTNPTKSTSKPIARPRILTRLQEKINALECELQNVSSDSHLWRGNETHELLLPIMTPAQCQNNAENCANTATFMSWEGEAEIQSGDILIVEINDELLNQHFNNITNIAHNTQVYQVTRSGHEHCDVTEGILLDITPLVVDGRKLVTLYDKDLTEGVNLLIVVSELWGSQCVRLKVTTKTDNCGENADCSGKGVCYSNTGMEEYECQCCSGFAGPHCEEIDACTPSPCTNNGICVDLSQGHEGNSYQCLCPYGYAGKNCQYETDPCNPTECLNGGTCVGNATHFRCDCTVGFTGPLCQRSLNECESSPCVHGICVDQQDGFRCFCQPGFAGELCNFEYNECESNPCQNGGECIDHIGSYECRCTKGYTGNRCQIKVDFCANKPCPEGQRCMDHGNDYSCECPEGQNGLDCNQMPRTQCNVNPCTHGGTCWSSGESFYCACRPGYTGTMCEDEFVVETVVSSSEFMVDDTSARNFNDKTFGSSVVLKSPIELHNAYFAAGVLAAAIFIVAIVVTICHCKVNQTYRKFSTRSTTFFPILGFGRRPKAQNKLNKHWLSGKGLGSANALRASPSTASLTARGHHLPPTTHTANGNQCHSAGAEATAGQLYERPFPRHLAMNLENDMYYTVDFSENSQHSPLIQ